MDGNVHAHSQRQFCFLSLHLSRSPMSMDARDHCADFDDLAAVYEAAYDDDTVSDDDDDDDEW